MFCGDKIKKKLFCYSNQTKKIPQIEIFFTTCISIFLNNFGLLFIMPITRISYRVGIIQQYFEISKKKKKMNPSIAIKELSIFFFIGAQNLTFDKIKSKIHITIKPWINNHHT